MCSECGQQFVTRNMPHSCGHHSIDEHFVGKPPEIRQIFDALVRAVRRCGRVHVYAQKIGSSSRRAAGSWRSLLANTTWVGTSGSNDVELIHWSTESSLCSTATSFTTFDSHTSGT